MPDSSALFDGLDTSRPTVNLKPRRDFLEATALAAWRSVPRVNGYELLGEIGSGGMGIVHKARHRGLNRIVALKMLRGFALADAEARERFRAEAEAVARLQHPNIIQVFEIGECEPSPAGEPTAPFIALEFVEGGSLAQRTGKPQSPWQAAELVEKLARAVHSAHELGVVHRDLKPANVLLTRAGEPKIADFGVAKRLEAERDGSGHFVTQAGFAVGTPEYMPPEQASGKPATPSIDIYALGVILYELLTARVPFQGATPIDTMSIVHDQEAVPPRRLQPGLPRDLETICLKCLEKLPAKRYGTALALAEDLRRFLDGRPILARRTSEFERATRWCRRNPIVTGSVAGIVVTVLISLALVMRSNWKLEKALGREAEQRQEAERKEQAERWERYRANITAAASLFDANDASGARRSLEASPKLHRNWEWRHFQSRVDLAYKSIEADGFESIHQAFVSGGSKVYFFGADELRILDTTSGKSERRARPTRFSAWTTFSGDGRRMTYQVGETEVEIWDVEADRTLRFRHGHGRGPSHLEFNSSGTRLATACPDKTIRIWDAATGLKHFEFAPYDGKIQKVRYSPNGKRMLVYCPERQSLGLWDAETGARVAPLTYGKTGFRECDFSGDGKRLITQDQYPESGLKLWDAETGRLIADMKGHSNTLFTTTFSPDFKRIATCSMDQSIGLWNAETGERIAMLKGHLGWVNSAAFSPDGKRLVSASQDQTLRLWDGETGQPINVLPGHSVEVHSVAYAPDGVSILSISHDSEVRYWDTRRIELDGVLRGHRSFVYGVACHPDGRRVVSGAWDGTARVWDTETQRPLASFDHGEGATVTSVAIHPDGKLLATRTRDAVTLWDLDSGREVHRWNSPSDPYLHTRLAFSPKGDLIATGGIGDVIHLWDVNSRAEIAVLRGHTNPVRDVVFSPDGRWLASSGESADRTIRIWSVAEKREVQVLRGHTDCVYALAFNSKGTTLASGSRDDTVRLWNTTTWEPMGDPLKHGTDVYSLAFTPDGTRLAAACANNVIRLWDTETRQELVDLRGHEKYVHAIAFSPNGERLISGSGDGTLRIRDTVRPQDRTPVK